MISRPLAIIDFNAGAENQGISNITRHATEAGYTPVLFDLRQKNELPLLKDFDIFVSSGGPGDPNEYGAWGHAYFKFLHALLAHNTHNPASPKRYFAICHSFQMLCAELGIGKASLRPDGRLFGIHPQQKIHGDLPASLHDLPDTFETLESRFYEVLLTGGHPDFVPFCKSEHALTGVISRDGHIIATQFHPEADPQNVQTLLNKDINVKKIAALHGEESAHEMRGKINAIHTSHNVFKDFFTSGTELDRL